MSTEGSDFFLSIPCRVGSNDHPDWNLCIPYIQSHHTQSCTPAVEQALQSMKEQHKRIVDIFQPGVVASKFNDSFVQTTMVPYCRRIVQAQGHLPLYKGTISPSLAFSWQDTFCTRSEPSDDAPARMRRNEEVGTICSQDAYVELLSCVYNMAAGYSAVGVRNTALGTTEGLKAAYLDFQNCAGYLETLEEAVSRAPDNELENSNDLQKESISELKKIALAQAHHCGYLSARAGQKPESLLSKLAVKASDMYEAVHINQTPLRVSEAGNLFSAYVATAALVFRARAHVHLAVAAEKDGEMGVALAYYSEAVEFLDRIPALTGNVSAAEWSASVKEAVRIAQLRAEKANNTVFRQKIPNEVPVPVGLPSALGKALVPPPFLQFEEPKRETDPFFGIVPPKAASPVRKWREASEKLIETSVQRAKKMQRNMMGSWTALGVEMLLESMEGNTASKIPPTLREQLVGLRNGSEGKAELVAPILKKLELCQTTRETIEKKLQDGAASLKKALEEEIPYKRKYGEVIWRSEFPDPSQSEVYTSLKGQLEAERKNLDDRIFRPLESIRAGLYDEASELSLIEMPLKDLEILIPSAKPAGRLADMCNGLRSLSAHRDAIMQLQNAAIVEAQSSLQSDALVYEVASAAPTQQKGILERENGRLKEKIRRIDQINGEYEALIRKVEESMSSIAEEQSMDKAAAEGQKVLNSVQKGITRFFVAHRDLEKVVEQASRSSQRCEECVKAVQFFRTRQTNGVEAAQKRVEAKISTRLGHSEPTPSPSSAQQNLYAPPSDYSYAPPPTGNTQGFYSTSQAPPQAPHPYVYQPQYGQQYQQPQQANPPGMQWNGMPYNPYNQ